MKLKCNKCNLIKSEKDFYKCKACKNGYVKDCKKCRSEYAKKYRELNKTNITKQQKEYRNKNKDKIKKRNKKYRENNKERIRFIRRQYKKMKWETDPLFKLKETYRSRIYAAFKVKYWNKGNTTKDILGIDYIELFKYIENKFTDNMSWDNQGEWHIDHIIPLSSANTKEELIKLCHYTNLQPLWAEDNLKKGGCI